MWGLLCGCPAVHMGHKGCCELIFNPRGGGTFMSKREMAKMASVVLHFRVLPREGRGGSTVVRWSQLPEGN